MNREEAARIRAAEPENDKDPAKIIERLVRAMEKWAEIDEDCYGAEGIPEEATPAYDEAKAFLGEIYTTADGFVVDPGQPPCEGRDEVGGV